MTNKVFVNDKGLFFGQSEFEFSLPVPFETIVNNLKIIKEQYDYIRSDPASSNNHIQDIFRAFGYQAEKQDLRLITLSDMGNNGQPKVLALLISLDENLNELIPGLDWSKYLFFAANYHHVRWGLITNGKEIRIFDFQRPDYQKTFFAADLGGIVEEGRLEDFFSIYKIFSFMRSPKGETLPPRKIRKPLEMQDPVSSEYNLAYHINGVTQSTVDLFDKLRARVFTLSNSVTEKFNKNYIGYSDRKYFCEIWIQKHRLKIWVNVTVDEISDSFSLCRDVRGIGHYGSGDVEINLEKSKDLYAVFEIIKQAYEKNK